MEYKGSRTITIENTPFTKELYEAAPDMYEALKAIAQCCLVTEYSAEYRIELMEQTAKVVLGKLEGRQS